MEAHRSILEKIQSVLSGNQSLSQTVKSLPLSERQTFAYYAMGEAIVGNRRDLFEWAFLKVPGTARVLEMGMAPYSWLNTTAIHENSTFFEFALVQNRPGMVEKFLSNMDAHLIPSWVWMQSGRLSSPEILRKILKHGHQFKPISAIRLERKYNTYLSTLMEDNTQTQLIQHECVLSAIIQQHMGFVEYLDKANINWNEVDHLGNHCFANVAPCIERTAPGSQRAFTFHLIDWLCDKGLDLHQRNLKGQSSLDIWEQHSSSTAQTWLSARWKNTMPESAEEHSKKRL